MLFDDVIWHDGLIQSVLIANSGEDGPTYKVQIEADIYSNAEMVERVHVAITFSEVRGIVTTFNIMELIDNYGPGNIANGYKKGDMSYILYFCDGYLEITAGKVDITVS